MIKKILNFLGFRFEKDKYNNLKVKLLFLPLNWLIFGFGIYLAFGILFGTVYMLDKKDEASVELFGKYSHTVGPGGIGVKIPFIMDVRKVRTQERHRWELGFRTLNTDPVTYEDHLEESVMLTKGGHLGEINWIIQYSINDPYNWLYKVRQPELVLDRLAQGSMRLIIGLTALDDILTTQKLEIQKKNQQLLQSYCDLIGLDVTIREVKLQDCGLPDKAVKEAYDQVMNALKEQEKLIKQADEYVKQVIPKAEGQASEIINQAEGYYAERINQAKGEVAKFLETYEAYQKDPETTRRKMWYNAMQVVLPNAKKTVIDNGSMLNIKNFSK
jgi:membrane protease subunit HflK